MATSGVHPEQQVVRERRRRSLAAEHEDAKARERLDGRRVLRLRRRREEKFGERRREQRPRHPPSRHRRRQSVAPRSDDPGREHRRLGPRQERARRVPHPKDAHAGDVAGFVRVRAAPRGVREEGPAVRAHHGFRTPRGAAGVDDVGDIVRAVARVTVRRPPPAAAVASVTSDVGHRDPAFAHLQRRLAVVVSPARRGTRSQADGQRAYARD